MKFVVPCVLWFQSSHWRCSLEKGVQENFVKFTEKHLGQSLFFNKVTGLWPATFCFFENLFYRTRLDDCLQLIRTFDIEMFLKNFKCRKSIYRSSHWRCSVRKGMACNFIKKETSGTVVFLWIFAKFLRTPFYRTPLDDCFCI